MKRTEQKINKNYCRTKPNHEKSVIWNCAIMAMEISMITQEITTHSKTNILTYRQWHPIQTY